MESWPPFFLVIIIAESKRSMKRQFWQSLVNRYEIFLVLFPLVVFRLYSFEVLKISS